MSRKYFDPAVISRLKNMEVKARSVVEGFMLGLHKSPYMGYNVDFAGHRSYVQGDSTRDIDWKAYGRSDKLYIKQYEEETNLKSYILLDASASMGYAGSSKVLRKFEYSCYIAAVLSYLMLKQNDYAGLVTFDTQIRDYISPAGSIQHIRNLLATLEKCEPGNTTRVSGVFHVLAEKIVRRGLIIIISDLWDDVQDVISGIKHLKHKKHEVLVFHVLDNAEIQLPFRGYVKFVDSETGRTVSTSASSIDKEYKESLRNWVNGLKRSFGAGKISYVNVNTSTPYDRILMHYLQKRQKLYR